MRAELSDSLVSGQVLRAIDWGEIEVFYQPVVRLGDRRIVGSEALARWHHPRRGYISPAEFIPAAERTGAITALDRQVLRVAATQVQLWSTGPAPRFPRCPGCAHRAAFGTQRCRRCRIDWDGLTRPPPTSTPRPLASTPRPLAGGSVCLSPLRVPAAAAT